MRRFWVLDWAFRIVTIVFCLLAIWRVDAAERRIVERVDAVIELLKADATSKELIDAVEKLRKAADEINR